MFSVSITWLSLIFAVFFICMLKTAVVSILDSIIFEFREYYYFGNNFFDHTQTVKVLKSQKTVLTKTSLTCYVLFKPSPDISKCLILGIYCVSIKSEIKWIVFFLHTTVAMTTIFLNFVMLEWVKHLSKLK